MEECELCRAAARRLRESISSIYLGGYRHLRKKAVTLTSFYQYPVEIFFLKNGTI